jgi:hypothetical protein
VAPATASIGAIAARSPVATATGSAVTCAASWVLGLGRSTRALRRAGAALALLLALAACTHRVQVEAPKDPIVINLNVKIEQEVRVKVEEDVDDLFADNPDLF